MQFAEVSSAKASTQASTKKSKGKKNKAVRPERNEVPVTKDSFETRLHGSSDAAELFGGCSLQAHENLQVFVDEYRAVAGKSTSISVYFMSLIISF